MRQNNLATRPYRFYDPNDYVKGELKKLKNYTLPPSKDIPQKYLIANIIATREEDELLRKYEDIMRVNRELKRIDPNFKGLCVDIP